MITTDHHPEHFGTDHDPILAGVAKGLRDLFPPIHNLRHVEADVEPAGEAAADDRAASARD